MTQKTNGTASGSAEGIYWYRDGCKNEIRKILLRIWGLFDLVHLEELEVLYKLLIAF